MLRWRALGVLLLLLLPLAPSPGAGAIGLPSCSPGAILELDLSSGRRKDGVAMAPGEREDDWFIARAPLHAPPGGSEGPLQAQAIAPLPLWAAPVSNAAWVSLALPGAASSAGLVVPPGGPPVTARSMNGGVFPIPYEFTYTFAVDLSQWSQPQLSFYWAAKDTASITLNGVVLASQPYDASLALRRLDHDPALDGAFVNGTNTLVARVISSGAETAFFASGAFRATCRPDSPAPCAGLAREGIDLGTGRLASGSFASPVQPEAHWNVISYPGQPTWGPRPAHVIDAHPTWTNDPRGKWINPWSAAGPYLDNSNANAGGSASAPASATPYVYELRFTWDLERFPSPALDLSFASDNDMRWELNGRSIGSVVQMSSVSFQHLHRMVPSNATGALLHGVNVLRVNVTNREMWTGLLVVGNISCASKLPPCDSASPLHVDLSTGVDATGVPLPRGAPDVKWRATEAPGHVSPLGPAHVIDAHPTWVAPPPGSRWVSPWASDGLPLHDAPGGSPLAPGSTFEAAGRLSSVYRYDMTFSLDLATWKDPRLDLIFAADELAVTWHLNGLQIGQFAGDAAFALHSAHYDPLGNGAFKNGTNTLVGVMENRGGWTGLLASGAIGASCALPAT